MLMSLQSASGGKGSGAGLDLVNVAQDFTVSGTAAAVIAVTHAVTALARTSDLVLQYLQPLRLDLLSGRASLVRACGNVICCDGAVDQAF